MPRANKRQPEKKVNRKIRPVKNRKQVVKCKTGCKEFEFTRIESGGVKRKCRVCGYSIVEIAKAVFTHSENTQHYNHMTKMARVKV